MGEAFLFKRGNLAPPGPDVPPVGTSLEDCTWDDISLIAAEGLAEEYFAVGDCKSVYINGTVGTLAMDDTLYVYIIGFNHNGAENTIDFGTFKSALSGGKDICLINSYGSSLQNGGEYFNMNHWGRANYGGWKGCDLRYDVLGSTDVEPSDYGSEASSGRTGYDATSTCATSPVSNTLMAALPVELRAVMKPMTIYTDNVGGGSDTASYVTASVDYLPLLAEYEIFGTRKYANGAEKNYQAQYAYYSSGNSKVKYRYSSTSRSAYWWERSAYYEFSGGFCFVTTSGSADYGNAHASYGLTPIFRV